MTNLLPSDPISKALEKQQEQAKAKQAKAKLQRHIDTTKAGKEAQIAIDVDAEEEAEEQGAEKEETESEEAEEEEVEAAAGTKAIKTHAARKYASNSPAKRSPTAKPTKAKSKARSDDQVRADDLEAAVAYVPTVHCDSKIPPEVTIYCSLTV